MNQKMIACKSCGQEIAKNAKFCPHCGTKNKKSILKRWWFWAIVVVVLCSVISSSGEDSGDKDLTNSTVETEDRTPSEATDTTTEGTNATTETANTGTEGATHKTEEPAKTEYRVGDILEDGNTRILFMSSGDYVEENEFLQPAQGNKYIYLQFAFENISDHSDTSVSAFSFECFADGYATEMYYGGEEALSATLSPGRQTTGFIYFEVPVAAEVIEIEYETNIFTEEKIKFIFEGTKDSGYSMELNPTPTANAYSVGEVVESEKLKITYLSCEEYVSDNMFIVPAEGYHFISCEFEFENTGTSDEFISSYDFDCYADGVSCNATFIRDDNLSATLSAGRKTKGTVTFEVPLDAATVEVEYLSNYWTSNRVVFNAN